MVLRKLFRFVLSIISPSAFVVIHRLTFSCSLIFLFILSFFHYIYLIVARSVYVTPSGVESEGKGISHHPNFNLLFPNKPPVPTLEGAPALPTSHFATINLSLHTFLSHLTPFRLILMPPPTVLPDLQLTLLLLPFSYASFIADLLQFNINLCKPFVIVYFKQSKFCNSHLLKPMSPTHFFSVSFNKTLMLEIALLNPFRIQDQSCSS